MVSQFIWYSKCSTCIKAKRWLQNNNIPFEERPIKENNPKESELRYGYQKVDYL